GRFEQEPRRLSGGVFSLARKSGTGRSGFGRFLGLQARLVRRALGRRVAVHEFNDRHRRHVAIAEAGLQDAHVATLTLLVAGPEYLEQARDMLVLLQLRRRQAAGVQIATLCERDQLLHDRAQFLRLGKGGLDLFVFDERTGHVGPERLAMLVCTVQAAIAAGVTHFKLLSVFCFVRRAWSSRRSPWG